ncbi:MAG: GNAT family N-acetyltransferase [Candidatus Bathyarchaeia archaeon]
MDNSLLVRSARHQDLKRARVKLRRATLRDIDMLVHQRRGMWLDMGKRNRAKLDEHDRAFRRWVQPRLRNGRVVGWVIETEGKDIVAGGIVWLRPAITRPRVPHLVQPYLLSMYTEPQWRRRGLASLIVGEAVKWAKRNGYTGLWLHASAMGRMLYVRHGFKRTWEMILKL